MKIKGADGNEYHVTGSGQGNFNSVGAAGGIGWIAEKLFNGNLFNGGGCAPNGADAPISRYEASMMNEMAGKDSKIALLEAQIYTDQQTDKKVGEAIAFVRSEVKELAAEVRANKNAQDAINMQQAVYNGVNTSAVECIKGQIAQLLGLTKLVVPNASVCPGWGNVTVTPAAAPTTGA
jgi:ribosomal protein L29